MKHLLDTDICIYAIKHSPPVIAYLNDLDAGEVGMSVVAYLELVHGAWKSARPAENLRAVEDLVRVVEVVPLGAEVALHYARVRRELEKAGTPIGSYDMLIAAHALSLGLTLVTNNTREFKRVKGLRIENCAR
jgi:tRNA(fMet)-specific endonuclease VapC